MTGAETSAPPESLRGIVVALLAHAPRQHRAILVVAALTVVAAFAEVITVGSFLPFMAVLLSPAGGRVLSWVSADHRTVLLILLASMTLAALIATGVRIAMVRATNRLAFRIGHDLSGKIFHNLVYQPYASFVRQSPAVALASLEKIQLLIFSFLLPVIQALAGLCIAAAILALLVAIAPFLIVALSVPVIVLYFTIGRAIGPRLARNASIVSRTGTARMKSLNEGIGGLRDIVLYRAQPVFETAFTGADREYRQAQADNTYIAMVPRLVIEGGIIIIACGLGAFSGAADANLLSRTAVLGAFGLGVVRLLPVINGVYVGWTMAAGNRGVARDVLRLLSSPRAQDSLAPQPPLRFSGVELRNVHLAYPDRSPILTAVSLDVSPGEWVGLVGATGAGKSSLLDIAMGLIEPTAGLVFVNDCKLDEGNRLAWQRAIGHVSQSVYLVDSSIADNIRFGITPAAGDEDLMRRVTVDAAIDAFIETLPQGLLTIVGDKGVRLSGGQRQRIAIARALYRMPSVLILDEATSQLDQATEDAIIFSLRRNCPGLTVLMTSHRPSSLAHCDRIVELRNGSLVPRSVLA